MKPIALVLAAASLLGACSALKTDVRERNAGDAAAAFDYLKSLQGRWHGDASNGTTQFPIDVSYEVVSAGTAVMERMFPGTPHEMISMYHRDGGTLLMTHYCSQGNQPRMSMVAFDPADHVLKFTFRDATNHASSQELIMHDMELHGIDHDHIQTAWTAYVGGKPDHTGKFDFTRVAQVHSTSLHSTF